MPELDDTSPVTGTQRRAVLGALLAGAAVPLLAGCGSDDTSSGASDGPATSAGDPTSPSAGGASTVAIASTADVPKGGGLILDDPKIVITQPVAGEFKGFTSICTHQGCPVNNVTDGTINCTCHGSMYSIKDGSVVGGPAPAPLAEMPIKVTGEDIALA